MSAQGQHGASPEGSLGGGMEMRVRMTEPQRVQCPWLRTLRTDEQACEGLREPRAQALCWEVPVPTSRLPGHQAPCRGAHLAGAAAPRPPVSDGSNEAPGMQKSKKTCPTEMRSTTLVSFTLGISIKNIFGHLKLSYCSLMLCSF